LARDGGGGEEDARARGGMGIYANAPGNDVPIAPTTSRFVVVVVTAARAYSKKHPPPPPPPPYATFRAHDAEGTAAAAAVTTTTATLRRRGRATVLSFSFLINICTGLACLVIYSVYPPRLRGDARIIVDGRRVLIGPRRAAPESFFERGSRGAAH